jgi:hypothetical protein
MLKTIELQTAFALTGYIAQLSSVIIHREPPRRRYAVHAVGVLPLWENIGYGCAVIHFYVRKTDAKIILG